MGLSGAVWNALMRVADKRRTAQAGPDRSNTSWNEPPVQFAGWDTE